LAQDRLGLTVLDGHQGLALLGSLRQDSGCVGFAATDRLDLK